MSDKSTGWFIILKMVSPHLTPTWRLILSPAQSGAWNMACDEALLEGIGKHVSPPTIRLYSWAPPCLSLGYSQPASDIDLEKLNNEGWDLVGRPTGGRAILHIDELTYAVIAPQDHPLVAGSLLDSYQRISLALLAALHQLGVDAIADATYPPTEGADPKGPVCFEVPSNFEITCNRKKLIGSAQARKKGGVLQHGAIPLRGDISRITKVLRFPDEDLHLNAQERVKSRATTLSDILSDEVAWQDCADALILAFTEVLGIEFETGDLNTLEIVRVGELINEKYCNPEWIYRS